MTGRALHEKVRWIRVAVLSSPVGQARWAYPTRLTEASVPPENWSRLKVSSGALQEPVPKKRLTEEPIVAALRQGVRSVVTFQGKPTPRLRERGNEEPERKA